MHDALKNIPLFADVDPVRLKNLADCFTTPRHYATGQQLMEPGDKTCDVFFLTAGRVRLSLLSPEGNPVSYREIVPYDYFGWLSALDGRERLTAAVALEPAQAFVVAGASFRALLLADPRIHDNFMQRMGGAFRRYTERIQELTLLPARERIVRELVRRCHDGNATVDLGSHEDFATWTGTTRETVTRTLAALEKEGFIQKQGSAYRLLKAHEDAAVWLNA